ncbi:DUF4184 family protein [Pseudoneobacillus sp. C159]
MPLTFAHPAAVLPFSRKSKYVNFLAMVLGSMSPDFEYFLRGKPYGEIGHTFIGFVTFNLPIVLVIYFLYQAYIHRTLFSHLPNVLQITFTKKANSPRSLKVIVFLYSALLGMLTHVIWDSFTHTVGFKVKNLSILTNTIHLFDYTIPIYKFLQHGSTILGITTILGYMYFQTVKNRCHDGGNIRLLQKLMFWGQIGFITTLIFLIWYFIEQISIESYGIIVVRIIDSVLISLLIVSLYFKHFIRAYF